MKSVLNAVVGKEFLTEEELAEIIQSTPSDEKFYALLPWEQYHKLESAGGAYILPAGETSEEKIRDEHQQTEVLLFASSELADEAAMAFNTLCAAAWTSNQSMDERAENQEICADADKKLTSLRRRALPQ